MTALHWQDLTSAEAAGLDPARTVVAFPVGATEQHGPHLPLGTDTLIAEGVAARFMALVPPDLPVVVLPGLAFGKSNEHQDFAGTLTLSAETMIRMLREIGTGVARTGLRKMLFVNAHGGQPQVLDIVAQDLRADHGMIVHVANVWRLMDRPAHFPPGELAQGLHGGAVETSLMLSLRPDLVRSGRIGTFPSAIAALGARHPKLAGGGRPAFAWQAQDLNPAGAVGDARLARPEIGARLIDDAAAALVALARELSALPLETARTRPNARGHIDGSG